MPDGTTRRPLFLAKRDWARGEQPLQGRFEGAIFETGASVIFYVTETVGDGPPLHVHEYDEIFVVRDGRARFTVGDQEIEAEAGDVLFGPAHVPHRFENLGPGRLATMDVHVSDRIAQVNLD